MSCTSEPLILVAVTSCPTSHVSPVTLSGALFVPPSRQWKKYAEDLQGIQRSFFVGWLAGRLFPYSWGALQLVLLLWTYISDHAHTVTLVMLYWNEIRVISLRFCSISPIARVRVMFQLQYERMGFRLALQELWYSQATAINLPMCVDELDLITPQLITIYRWGTKNPSSHKCSEYVKMLPYTHSTVSNCNQPTIHCTVVPLYFCRGGSNWWRRFGAHGSEVCVKGITMYSTCPCCYCRV